MLNSNRKAWDNATLLENSIIANLTTDGGNESHPHIQNTEEGRS